MAGIKCGPEEAVAGSQLGDHDKPGEPARGKQRREHTKTRGGCITCKQRHIRCDQRKPICVNCLVRPGNCGYPGGPLNTTASRKLLPMWHILGRPPRLAEATSAYDSGLVTSPVQPTPLSHFDPFGCLPMQNNRRNSELFYFYNDFHGMVCTAEEKKRGTALDDSVDMSIILLMASVYNKMMLAGSSSEASKSRDDAYLICKMDAIRAVQEKLSGPETAFDQIVIAFIVLCLMNSENSSGDMETAKTHAKGFFAMHHETSPVKPNVWRFMERLFIPPIIFFTVSRRAAALKRQRETSPAHRDPSSGGEQGHPVEAAPPLPVTEDSTRPSPTTAQETTLSRPAEPSSQTRPPPASPPSHVPPPKTPASGKTSHTSSKPRPILPSSGPSQPTLASQTATPPGAPPSNPSMPPLSHRVPINQRPKAPLLPKVAPGSHEGWSLVAYTLMHLSVGFGFNPRVPVDHDLLRWMLSAPPAGAAHDDGGESWMWKQVASAYCLIVAASHPVAEAWARAAPGGEQRRAAESADDDGLIRNRQWYDELLRPGARGGAAAPPSGPDDLATRLLSWDMARAVLDRFEWLETEEGRRLATRVWEDARRQPFGLVSLL